MEKVAKDILSYSEKLEIVSNFLHEVDAETFADNLAHEKMEEGWNKGIKKGIEQGIEKGIEQGIEQGIKQGTREANIKNAKAMLKKGIDIKIISEITELSIKEIEELN